MLIGCMQCTCRTCTCTGSLFADLMVPAANETPARTATPQSATVDVVTCITCVLKRRIIRGHMASWHCCTSVEGLSGSSDMLDGDNRHRCNEARLHDVALCKVKVPVEGRQKLPAAFTGLSEDPGWGSPRPAASPCLMPWPACPSTLFPAPKPLAEPAHAHGICITTGVLWIQV